MQTSSFTRRKAAFVPWLAALVLAATAHLGWIVHELREPEPRSPAMIVHVEQLEIDARSYAAPRSDGAAAVEPAAAARYVLTVDCDALADAGLLGAQMADFDALARELGLSPTSEAQTRGARDRALVLYGCPEPAPRAQAPTQRGCRAANSAGSRSISPAIAYEERARVDRRRAHERRQHRVLRRVHHAVGGDARVGRTSPDR